MNAPEKISVGEFRVIPLDQIKESKTNPRRHWDKAADAELAKSIKEQGVVEPIIVRPAGKEFELVAGARRFRQSKVAGLSSIPAIVRNYSDAVAMEVQVIENLQRKDIHPLDEAFGFDQLLNHKVNGKPVYDIEAIAEKVGKSASYVYQRLKLVELIGPAQQALEKEENTAGHAILIARLPAKDQQEALEYCTDSYDNVSVRDLTHWIESEIHLDLHSAAFKKDDAKLLPEAGACTTCTKRTGFQPALFPDIKKKDTCTDRACFQKKVSAHLVQVQERLKAEGKKVITISSHYSRPENTPPGTLMAGSYKEVESNKKRCDSAVQALVVDGSESGKIKVVCTKKGCKVHDPYSSSSSFNPHTGRSRAEEQKKLAYANARKKAAEILVKNVKAADTNDWRLIGYALLAEMWTDHRNAIARRRGMDGKKHKDAESFLRKAIDKAQGKDLTGLVLELSIFGRLSEADVGHYDRDGRSIFIKALKRHRVNLASLQAKELAALKAKKKAGTKKKAKLQTSAKKKPATKAKKKKAK